MAQVSTFYSYKGGSGRSMAMANVAWALATNGERVLAIDWDLEAPGLHRYFHPFLADPEQSSASGLVDRIWEYLDFLGHGDPAGAGDRFDLASCDDIVQPLDLPLRSRQKGCLHMLGAGRQDDLYSEKVGGLDWAAFYERFDGQAFINRLIDWARLRYTHILIDSRTGVADTAGICTAQIPDALVLCLVYNRQSIEGSAAIARSVVKARSGLDMPKLDIHTVPCRVEERGVVESARRHAANRLSKSLKMSRSLVERTLRRDEVRHYPWCAFEEKLAVFEDVPDERGSMLDIMHELARRLSGRKDLKITYFEPDILASIWRRAAFDDPRIADLELLEDATFESRQSQLIQWIEEASSRREERPDWLIALGEAAISAAGAADDRSPPSIIDHLGSLGLRVGHRALEADPQLYRTRFALLLQTRAAQLQRLGRGEEALPLLQHAAFLFDQDRSSVSRWRLARVMERRAEVLVASGRSNEAVDAQRAAVEGYLALGRRGLPLGAAIDPARALRILAEMYVEQGHAAEAEEVLEQALHQLQTAGRSALKRDIAEVANVLSARADLAVAVGGADAERQIVKARIMGHDLLPEGLAFDQLDWRLRLAAARLEAQSGRPRDAIMHLEALRRETPPPSGQGDLVEVLADALVDAGREDEAANLLIEAALDDRHPFTRRFIEQLRRALNAAGRNDELIPIFLTRIERSGRRESAGLRELLQEVALPAGGSRRVERPPATSGEKSKD